MNKLILGTILLTSLVGCGKRTEIQENHYIDAPETEFEARFETLRCESYNFGYRECYTKIDAVKILTVLQTSTTRCRLNRNYGILDAHRIWVDKGCRANFIYTNFIEEGESDE